MKVYVVTGLDLGWDCVVGVFANVNEEALLDEYPPMYYVVTEREVEETLS